MDKKSLSSTYLYHFKNDIEVIKTILQNGFTYRMWDESIPYKISIQQNFMVCFCDIRIVDSQSHRDVYGNNAIVLTKAWGINKGVTPVQYIHKNSPVISKKYLDLKTSFRQIRDDGNDKIEAVLNDYMVHLMLKYKKKSTNGLFQDEIDYSLNDKEIIENEFHDILEFCKEGKKDIIKFISSLFLRIVDLHGELECRDSYMKIYKRLYTD